jgi:hypothetical protein
MSDGITYAYMHTFMRSLGLCIVPAVLVLAQPNRNLTTEPVSHLPSSSMRWALIMRVDQYQDSHIHSVGGAANDARTLADALDKYAGFPRDRIIVMATGKAAERQATRVNILRRLFNLHGPVPSDGLSLFSYSHGIEREGKGFLIPSDAQWSEDIEFLEETTLSLGSVKARVRSVKMSQALLPIDACRTDPGGGPDQSRGDAGAPLSQRFVVLYRNGKVAYQAPAWRTGFPSGRPGALHS